MKKKLFIFLLMLFLLPFGVKAEEFYFNHSEYKYSKQYLEQTYDLEVEVIQGEQETLYRYRTRDYLILPHPLVIYGEKFDILSTFDTNLPLEDIEIIKHYDLETMNHCYSHIDIIYGNTKIHKSVYISIDNYINIPKEIVVKNKNFNIWDYIDTDVQERENIEIIGNYDLNQNGEYEVIVRYKYIEEKTKIIVDMIQDKENKEEKVEIEDNNDFVVDDNEKIKKDETKEIFNTYVNNYYELKNPENKTEYIEKIVPVTNKIIYEKAKDNQVFNYVTYAFYGITIILLSIIVVRKK